MKLEDEALSGVNGGAGIKTANKLGTSDAGYTTTERDCPVCKKKTTFKVYMGGRAFCSVCGYQVNDA